MKNKLAYRRKALITMQKTVRGYLVRLKQGPRLTALKNIRTLDGNLKKIEESASQLKQSRDTSINEINKLKGDVSAAIDKIKVITQLLENKLFIIHCLYRKTTKLRNKQ